MADQAIKRIFGVRQSNGGTELIGFHKQNALYAADAPGTTPDGFDINNPLIDWYMGPEEDQSISLGDYNLPSAIIAYTHFTQEGRQAVSTKGVQPNGNPGEAGTEPAYVAFKRCAAAVAGDDTTGAGVVADQSFIDMALEVAALNNGPSTFHNSFDAYNYINGGTVNGGAWTNFTPEPWWAFNNATWKWAVFQNCDGNFGIFRVNPDDAIIITGVGDSGGRIALDFDYHNPDLPGNLIENWTPYGMTGWQPQVAGALGVVFDSKAEAIAAHQLGSELAWLNYEGVADITLSDCELGSGA